MDQLRLFFELCPPPTEEFIQTLTSETVWCHLYCTIAILNIQLHRKHASTHCNIAFSVYFHCQARLYLHEYVSKAKPVPFEKLFAGLNSDGSLLYALLYFRLISIDKKFDPIDQNLQNEIIIFIDRGMCYSIFTANQMLMQYKYFIFHILNVFT